MRFKPSCVQWNLGCLAHLEHDTSKNWNFTWSWSISIDSCKVFTFILGYRDFHIGIFSLSKKFRFLNRNKEQKKQLKKNKKRNKVWHNQLSLDVQIWKALQTPKFLISSYFSQGGSKERKKQLWKTPMFSQFVFSAIES